MWHPDALEVHVLVQDNARNKAKEMEDSQKMAHGAESTPHLFI